MSPVYTEGVARATTAVFLALTVRTNTTHQFGPEFKAAAHKEYSNLERKGTFRTVLAVETKGHFVIPVMWVFTYKFNTDGYLDRFKARLVVRGDLQPTAGQDNYAATLAARLFRCLMAITAQFNLDTH
jgi:hypothetical protein